MSYSSPDSGSTDDRNDDFVMLENPKTLSIRSKDEPIQNAARIEFNQLKNNNSFLVTIHPPAKPLKDITHIPCDIVLVIDVSGSMAELAPLPDVEDESERESSGLTVLDLVRHACRTIISTLDEGDRLALVTFSQDAKVIQTLTNMTPMAKAKVLDEIEKLKDEGATNLWAGIRAGLAQFENNLPIGNVQGLYILTDGQPNYMCPQQGYIPKLKPMLESLDEKNCSTPLIQTFGFGYSIRSDLMLSIAQAGNGSYAFIPEVGMIGTVFVHATANLYATYTTNAVLELSAPKTDGASSLSHRSGLPTSYDGAGNLLIKLGNIQYGQSRNLVITTTGWTSSRLPVNAKLLHTPHGKSREAVSQSGLLKDFAPLTPLLQDYHVLRTELCKFLSSLYPIDQAKDQHMAARVADVSNLSKSAFQALITQMTSIQAHTLDPNISSLLSDLIGPQFDPSKPEEGQIYQALSTEPQNKGGRVFKSYWLKWGRHYLSSLWCAHMRQTCNSFKDAGPLRYGTESELFKRCRDELDEAFDNLPAPTGTYRHGPGSCKGSVTILTPNNGMQIPGASRGHGLSAMNAYSESKAPVSMKRYNRRDNTCFLGTCPVTLASGTTIAAQDLRVGMMVKNTLSCKGQAVISIVKSFGGPGKTICRVNDSLWITPWHPIYSEANGLWVFPQYVALETRELGENEAVYSVLLTPSYDFDNEMEVGGVPCVTLGHGITWDVDGDVRAHEFFGDYDAVRRSLKRLPTDECGRHLCGGLVRDLQTDLVCGLLPYKTKILGESGCTEIQDSELDRRAHL